MAAAVRVRVLGAPRAVDDGGDEVPVPGERVGSALALLALRAGTDVAAADLADAVWGADAPANAGNALQALISRLRRVVGPGRVVGASGGYRLVVDPLEVDAAVFADHVERGATANRDGDPERAERLLRAAFDEWRGPLLGGAGANGPLAIEAVRLDELHAVAAEEWVDADLAQGRHEAVVARAERLVGEQPLRERRWAQLMLALYRAGRQADALRAYQRLRAVLVEELGIDPSRSLVELEAAVLSQDAALDWRPVRRASGRPTNLAPPPEVVGRDDDVRAVVAAVEANRLTVLLGPGGVGKTTLARAAVAALPDAVAPDGAFAVDLAAVPGPDRLDDARRAVAAAVPGGDRDEPDDRLARLAPADALVVLDGCEHLGQSAGELAAELLDLSPRSRVLMTSRARVEVPDRLPARPVVVEVGSLTPAAAVELFRRRAVAAGAVTDGVADHDVEALVAALDHLPLAVELAAARARFLSVNEIRQRLDDRLQLLEARSARTALDPRHRSLRAVLDASHALLSDDAARVYRRLSVLPASFTAAAAERVAGDDIGAGAVLDALVELVDQSLLIVRPGAEGPRYRFLDTVRVHAAERLDQAGERERAAQAMVRWVADWAEGLGFDGPEETAALRAADGESETVAAALAAASPPDRIRIVLAIWPWWDARAQTADGVRWLRAVLADLAGGLGGATPGRSDEGWARYALGRILERADDDDAACDQMRAAAEAGRAAEDHGLVARALGSLAYLAIRSGDFDAARPAVEEAAAHAAHAGDVISALAAGNASAFFAYASGRRREGAARWEATAELAGQAGLLARRATLLSNLGVALDSVDEPGRALDVLREAVDGSRAHGELQQAAQATANIVTVLRSLGRDDEARETARRVADELLGLGDERAATRALGHLVDLSLAAGERAAAHTAAIRLTEIGRRRGWPLETAIGLRAQGRVALAYGQAEQAVTLFQGCLAQLPREAFADTWAITLSWLGEAQLDAGDPEAALVSLQEARRLMLTVEDESVDDIDALIGRAEAALRPTGDVL